MGSEMCIRDSLTLVAGTHPKVGIPTSIITMALVSLTGLIIFGLIGGQLNIDLDSAGQVVAGWHRNRTARPDPL